MSCGKNDSKTRFFYTGNQPGTFNKTGLMNYVAGGLSGISASRIVSKFFKDALDREVWNQPSARMNQEFLDASFPFIELNFIVNIFLKNETFRVSNRNIYVEDENGAPRYYQARVTTPPNISMSLGEWLSPNFEIGEVQLRLNNRDGQYNDYLPNGNAYTQWINSKVEIKVGFGEKLENYFTLFVGYVSPKKSVETSDKEITIRVTDIFDKDEITLPLRVFDTSAYPDIDESYTSKPIPLLYGDWTTEVGDYGEIPAICTNGYQNDPAYYEFLIADNALREIGDVFLHRGYRTAEQNSPIKFSDSAIQKLPDSGLFRVPSSGSVLTENYFVVDKQQAGTGSGVGYITSQNSQTNFITVGVKTGDRVTKVSTGETGTVTGVGAFAILVSGLTFAPGDDFNVSTSQYKFIKGDKVSVKCRGKKLNNLSSNSLADANISTVDPFALTLGLNGTYFIADNSLKRIFEVSFANKLIKTFAFADIDPSLGDVSGMTYQVDDTIWLFDRGQSRFFRYDIKQNAITTSFYTAAVAGLGVFLPDAGGITIDENNYLYVYSRTNRRVYKIDPFSVSQPTLLASFHVSAFDGSVTEISDMSSDINNQNLVIITRDTLKVYRVNYSTGSLISSFNLSEIGPLTYPVGVSSAADGTLFIYDRQNNRVYNYVEGSIDSNPGFIARDVIQKNTVKVPDDFDQSYNNTCITYLQQFSGRLYLDDRKNMISMINAFLAQFSSNIYIKFQRYALFYIHFSNFKTDGRIVREGDIKKDSFKPSKEYSQYFNIAYGDYKRRPFSSNKKTPTDTYTSQAALTMVEDRKVTKKIDMSDVYARADIDKLMPLFLRLSTAEPEFVTTTLSFRWLFAQLNEFVNINFYDDFSVEKNSKSGGRRFDMVPAFIRKVDFDLSTMSVSIKAWSLGTTGFPGYSPKGDTVGGYDEEIVLNAIGRLGYISPVGYITEGNVSYVRIEDVNGQNAQSRTAPIVLNAWLPGMFVDIIDGSDHTTVATAEIKTVVGDKIEFVTDLSSAPGVSSFNAAGFVNGGHYIKHSTYENATAYQKKKFAFFGKPLDGYPLSSTEETEEQRSGYHNFPSDDGWPYLLYPKDYVAG